MTTPFGPQLIGETEKTLNALLIRHPRRGWSSHRTAVGDAARRFDVRRHGRPRRTRRRRGRPCALPPTPSNTSPASPPVTCSPTAGSPASGTELLERLQASLTGDISAVFGDLAPDDVVVTERVLNELVSRARVVLAS